MKNFEQVNGLKNLFSFSELRFLGMHKKGKLSNRLFQMDSRNCVFLSVELVKLARWDT